MKYIIKLNVEGHWLEIPCKNKKEFNWLSKMFEKTFPDKKWKTVKV